MGSEGPLHYTSVNNAYHLIGAINKLRQNSQLCDIFLHCGTTKIPAHKLILSVSSPYFKNLLSTKPEVAHAISDIQLNSLDGEGVQQLVEFFYTSAISLTADNVWKLLPAASLLQADEIITLCSDYLLTKIQVENCLQIHAVATKCLCSNLLAETTKFIKENFDKVIEEESFLELSVDTLISHLKRMKDVVLNEDQMVQAVKCWLIHSMDDRQSHGLKLVSHFPQMEQKLQDFIPADLLREAAKKTPEEKVVQDLVVSIKQEPIDTSDEYSESSMWSEKSQKSRFSLPPKGVAFPGQFPFPFLMRKEGANSLQMSKTKFTSVMNAENPSFSMLNTEMNSSSDSPAEMKMHYSSNSSQKNNYMRDANGYFLCSLCEKKFLYLCHLKEHIVIHETNGLWCEHCSFHTNYRQSMSRHLRVQHGIEKPYKRFEPKPGDDDSALPMNYCKEGFVCHCGFETHYKSSYDRHLKMRHDPLNAGLRTCTLCGKSFKRSDAFMKHQLTCPMMFIDNVKPDDTPTT